jgi:hypothetical protein
VLKKIAVPVLTIATAFLLLNGVGILSYPAFSYLKGLPLGRSFLSLADENYRRDLENQVKKACDEAEQYQMDREQIVGDIAYFEEMLALPTIDEIESSNPREEREIFQEQLDQRYRALRTGDNCKQLTKEYQSKYSE